MDAIKKVYIYKETVKNNHLKDKHAVQPDRIFEDFLQGEGRMT
jgi:hypothetical protein